MEEIGACMDNPQDQPPDLKGSYAILKKCYIHALEQQPKPSRSDIAKLSGDYVAFYKREEPPPPGQPIPTNFAPFQIEDMMPSEAEVETVALRINQNKAGVHTHLRYG